MVARPGSLQGVQVLLKVYECKIVHTIPIEFLKMAVEAQKTLGTRMGRDWQSSVAQERLQKAAKSPGMMGRDLEKCQN